MNKKQTTTIQETVDDKDPSAAAATLHPAAKAVDDPKAWSKTELLWKMIGKAADMDKTSLTALFDKVIGSVGKEGDAIPNGASEHNKATIVPHPSAAVKEDVEALFSGEELSEEFKEKAVTLFEAAVGLKVMEIRAELEEQLVKEYQESLDSTISQIEEEVTEKLDAYLGTIAEEWLEENEVAVVSQLKAQINEEFMDGLKNLFIEHYFDLPDEKVDIVETLVAQVAELQESLDKSLVEINTIKTELDIHEKEDVFNNMCEGLTLTQKEKLSVLCESIDTDISVEDFGKKVQIIKENQLLLNTKTDKLKTLNEEVTVEIEADELETNVRVPEGMDVYTKVISNTARKI